MSFLYIVVRVESDDELERLRKAVGRPWLPARARLVRYWVPSRAEAERERVVLFLAGFSSQIESPESSA